MKKRDCMAGTRFPAGYGNVANSTSEKHIVHHAITRNKKGQQAEAGWLNSTG
ncbi:hypothetical protein GJV26_26910 [Massilia dura]|uniref:Uncharacterized protein n=1 Tax=Pseudoduganella dura TaxID=321982 RepID=A0A6I3XNM3_9BURK|nr:hypothetical protein [Pseudoduganella dura]MUI16063.1 hypothetical protein [Pseudoduganella dura]